LGLEALEEEKGVGWEKEDQSLRYQRVRRSCLEVHDEVVEVEGGGRCRGGSASSSSLENLESFLSSPSSPSSFPSFAS
jgi:hypothetical protein